MIEKTSQIQTKLLNMNQPNGKQVEEWPNLK